jgi:hypothetical protein
MRGTALLLISMAVIPTLQAATPTTDQATPIQITDGCMPEADKVPTGSPSAILVIDATPAKAVSKLFTGDVATVAAEIKSECANHDMGPLRLPAVAGG